MADVNKQQEATASATGAPTSGTAQPRPCPQNCTMCSMPQQVYCSAKMLFDMSRALQNQRQQIAELTLTIASIQEQLKPNATGEQLSIPYGGEP